MSLNPFLAVIHILDNLNHNYIANYISATLLIANNNVLKNLENLYEV